MSIASLCYSVVIPYGKKSGDFIRCIKSITSQNISPKQILVICNGEVTHSYVKTIIGGLSASDFRLTNFIYPEKCSNGNIARNIGLNLVDTEWVMFVDSDDWWEANWISSVASISKYEEFDFLYGSMKIYSNQSEFKALQCAHFSEFKTPENYLLAYKAAQTSSYVIKTWLAKKTGWNEHLHRHQDYDFFVRLVKSFNVKSIAATDIYVNVDWSDARRTKYHLDYLRVVKGWKPNVERIYYLRHIRNLTIGTIKSRDWKAVLPFLKELIFASFFYKKFLTIPSKA